MARATQEATGASEMDIDLTFRWQERFYNQKMQVHYEARFDRKKVRSAQQLPRFFEMGTPLAFAFYICDAGGFLPHTGCRDRPRPSSELSGYGLSISEWRVGVSPRCLPKFDKAPAFAFVHCQC